MFARYILFLKRARQAHLHGRTSAERAAVRRTLHGLDTAVRRGHPGQEITVDILGHPMRGFGPRRLSYLFQEVFLTEEYRFPSAVPDPVIMDCGANVGFATLYFKHLFPAARIHAFEANPHVFRMLQHNITANGWRDVTAHNVALADQEGEIPFFLGDDPGTLRGSMRMDRGGTQEVRVPAQRLSTLLAALPRVDVVKMDVEGAEWAILADLQRSGLLAKPARYILEYHHQINGEAPRFSEFLAPFERAGFRYHLRGDIGAVDGFQDVLVHLARMA